MLGCKMKLMVKSYKSVFKTLCDKNTSSINKFSSRFNYTSPSSKFCLYDRSYIYALGFRSLKCSTSIYRRLHCFTKSPVRWYSAHPTTGLPQLTSLPQALWPGVFDSFSNVFLSYLVIRPFVDASFDLREFVVASKQVAEVVSRKLASNDIDGVEEMVTSAALSEIKQNLPKYSVSQRQELAIEHSDIYFTSPGAMNFRNDRDLGKKYLEIMMIHHVIRGYKDINFESFNPFQAQNLTQSQTTQNPFQQVKIDDNKAYILNYKFIREYSSDMASDWLLSGLNHYKKNQIVIPGFPTF